MTDRPSAPADRPGQDVLPAAEVASVTRHEERLRISTEPVGLERVRLQRYIVTEERTITVSLRREEVRVVREPLVDEPPLRITDEPRDGPVMILSEEQVVVSTRIVPVERVWLRRGRVVEQVEVDEVIRSERIDVVRDA